MKQHLAIPLFLAALLLLPAVLHAGESADNLAALSQELEDSDVIRVPFQQTRHIEALSRPLNSEGRLLFAREEGIAWIIEAPYPVFMVLTEDAITEWEKGAARKTTPLSTRPHLAALAGILRSVMTADMDALEKEFDVETSAEEDAWKMALQPKDEMLASALASISVRGAAHVERVTIVETGGDKTEIRFGAYETEPPHLSDEEKSYFAE
ncbi:outer membrane lipoprotein carrier protein LolA [Tepidicaulis sp. LMO-SS28]|uniref:outer membrane lipoprotein carrier protein LolA n=1 Tax=Tepidicaulis sp. LMO-SS28 TaxID=3447455 RepID=UPI003EDF2B8D